VTSGHFIDRLQTGLWRENPGLVQLLGLCPLLAVTSTFINGLGLGVATLVVLTCSNVLVSATRRWILAEIRVPIYVLIIASLVTCTELIFKAWFPALDRSLGIFIPLIVTNCAIVARAELFASRNGIAASFLDGLGMGAGFALLLMAIGFFRELVGKGSIFADFHMLFGGRGPRLAARRPATGSVFQPRPRGRAEEPSGREAGRRTQDVNREKRTAIYSRLRELNPHPTTELDYSTPFELLVAVILSAQATDVGVNKATAKLYEVASTPQAILDLGLAGLKSYIRTIGLFNSKAENIIKTCRILLDEHGGEVPRTREELERLPGVGRKTANVILNTAFGEPTIAVDTHIFRVANRTGIAKGKTPLEVEKRLVRLTPEEFKKDAHHWLILHGRYVCKARKPECWRCPIVEWCEYRRKELE
jgi:endonuclease-3